MHMTGSTGMRPRSDPKNTTAIASLTSLSELAIQASSKFSVEFINRLVSLESLKFVLGNLKSIAPIEALPKLRDLSFREVRNLEDLGDLERFPRLRRLQVSDQPRVAELSVGRATTHSSTCIYMVCPACRQSRASLTFLP